MYTLRITPWTKEKVNTIMSWFKHWENGTAVLQGDRSTQKGSPCGQDLIMYMHLKDNNKSIKDSDVKILDREDRWFERIVKEAIFVKLEQPSLRQGLSATYNAVLSSLAQQFRPNSHSDCNSPHLGGDSHSESNLTTVCDPVKCQGISSNWWIHLYEWRNILNIQ